MYWSEVLVALAPPGVATVTSTVPTDPGGEVAVIVVGLVTVNAVPVRPKATAVAPRKFAPLIVTVVPPMFGPLVGLMPVTVGATT